MRLPAWAFFVSEKASPSMREGTGITPKNQFLKVRGAMNKYNPMTTCWGPSRSGTCRPGVLTPKIPNDVEPLRRLCG